MWFVSSRKLQSGFILELLVVWLLVCFFVFVVVVVVGVFFCGLVCAREGRDQNSPAGLFWQLEEIFGSWRSFGFLACAGEQDPGPVLVRPSQPTPPRTSPPSGRSSCPLVLVLHNFPCRSLLQSR